MRHFWTTKFAGVGSKPPGSPSGAPAHVVDKSFAAETASNSRVVRWIVIFGIVLIGTIVAATGLMLQNLRDRELAESEHQLNNLTFILAEQIDRSFQSIELIQTAVIERMRSLGIASPEDYERQMSGRDTYQHLKDQIGGLPYVDALVLLDPEGKRINVSRAWPTPFFKKLDQDFLEAFNSDPHLTAFVGKPTHNPVTGTWVLNIARRFPGPNGEYLGVVLGVVTLQSFEQIFEAIAPTPNSSISLARHDGMLLARWPRQETAIGQSFQYREVFANVLSKSDQATFRRISVFDGKDRLISVHSLGHYPIVVMATTPVDDAVAHWRNGVIYIIATGIFLAAVVGGLVFLSALQVERRLRGQNKQFDAALNNMTQGLNMFDTAGRLVVCNERYLQMY
jgi:PAS domain-containing protein